MPLRSLLQSIFHPSPVIDERVEIGAAGAFIRRFELRENDVWFVELRPL